MAVWRITASVGALAIAIALQTSALQISALAQNGSQDGFKEALEESLQGGPEEPLREGARQPIQSLAELVPDTIYPPAVSEELLKLAVEPKPEAEPGLDAAPSTTASLSPVMGDSPAAGVSSSLSGAQVPSPALAAPSALPSDAAQTGELAAGLSALIAERLPLIISSIPRLSENERQGLVSYYKARENHPLWIADGQFSMPAKAVAARLADAAEDGLFQRDYPVPSIAAASNSAMVEAELRLSGLAVLYARDARGGRLEPRRISSMMTPKLALPSAADVLDTLLAASDANKALENYHPPHDGYTALKSKLAEIRKGRTTQEPMVMVPAGPPLRVGMRDARVPLIRARLNLGPDTNSGQDINSKQDINAKQDTNSRQNANSKQDMAVYDAELANAVSSFQKNAGLRVTGITGPSTIDAMRTSPASRLDADIVAQMERWRWLPADLGNRHVFVNIPEFTVRVMEAGMPIHTARVIIGKPETPTPVFSHVMDHLVVNPSWFIPPSIMKNDILPGLAKDPDYAAKRGYVVTKRGNNVTVRQPPGERNALGNVKFMFPNEHAVYLHDTPGRHLFSADKRAFSHGCVRVDQPMKLAEILLGRDEGWSEQRLRGLVGGGERTIRFTRPLAVHLTYMTHVVDANGNIKTFSDIYGFHQRVRSALGLSG